MNDQPWRQSLRSRLTRPNQTKKTFSVEGSVVINNSHWKTTMANGLLFSRSFSSGRFSSCALAFLATLSPNLSSQAFSTDQVVSSSSSRMSSSFTVAQFPCLSDNYGYLLHDPSEFRFCFFFLVICLLFTFTKLLNTRSYQIYLCHWHALCKDIQKGIRQTWLEINSHL